MYIRISRGRCEPSKCEEVLAGAEEVNPALRQLPGFQSSYWGVDRASGALVAVSTWDSRDHADFSRDALAATAADSSRRMLNAGAELEAPEIYEIAAHVS